MAREEINITNEDSSTLDLNDRTNYLCTLGAQGTYSTTEPSHEFGGIWNEAGEMYLGTKINNGNLVLPLVVKGTTRAAFQTAMRALTTLLRSESQTLTVEYVREDATSRTLTTKYLSGLSTFKDNRFYANGTLTFVAYDPFWQGAATYVEYTGATLPEFFPFSFPFTLAADNLFDSGTINYTGDENTWPDFLVTGPLTEITLTNSTLGLSFRVVYTLAAADTMTINFDPRRTSYTVQDSSDQSLFPYIDKTEMNSWYLAPGSNLIDIGILGADTGTKVRINYTPRYHSG